MAVTKMTKDEAETAESSTTEAQAAEKRASSVRRADETTKRGPDKQEYLSARKRVKGGIKVGIAIVVVAVLACIGGCVFAAVNPTPAGKVKVSKSSSSLAGQYYGDVQTLLGKDGFTNIELRPEGDLKIGVLHDEGDVDTVSIDGQTSFSSGTIFDKGAKVIISYHSYPAGSGSNTSSASNANANANSAKSASSSSAANTANASANTSASATTDSATFRKSVDDYEAFIDQYVAFMQTYTSDSSNAAGMAADYAKMLTQYEKLYKEMSSVDEGKLTAEDDAYYLAAMQRCNEKLLAVAA